ncbi:LOW QUALITY PROTEIN: hypothetical protein CFC21_045920 [Triticum aestivum]|uniref:Uncharacterized protein n=2 Tax=Triticum aestivum TaxID=4565 RepID=A0A3B6GMR9_WHEAT|nr:LOW QUALITY PROTEIN: hypothetical protein CFC21_045920 [Triticum aestivum]
MVSHFPSLAGLLASRLLVLYATTWSAVAAMSMAVTALAPEIAYVWGIASGSLLTKASPASKFAGGSISLPLDGCPCLTWSFRAGLFCRAVPDMVIPFMFAVVVITSVVGFTAAVGVWEDDNEVLR